MATLKSKKYIAEWEELARPLIELTGTMLVAFDPNIVLMDGPNKVVIPRWFAEKFRKSATQSNQSDSGAI